jgi:hypothetical protein
MLPAKVPNARILRFGYKSNWFGPDSIKQSVRSAAQRLLTSLKQERKVVKMLFWKTSQTDWRRAASIDR